MKKGCRVLGVWACNLFASGLYYQKFSYKIESSWFQCTNDDIWEIGMLSKWGDGGEGGGACIIPNHMIKIYTIF